MQRRQTLKDPPGPRGAGGFRLRAPILVALALSLAGCLAPEVPLTAQSVDALPSDAAPRSERLTFLDVSWEPAEPASGDDLVITARVVGVALRPDYGCYAVVARDGARGGGLLFSGRLARAADGLSRCAIPGGPADAVAFFLAGHDGERWVRSGYFVVPLADGPGAGRPGPDVTGLELAAAGSGTAARASVLVRDAFAQDVFLGASVVVNAWYLPASDAGTVGKGVLMEEARDGRFEGTIEFDPAEGAPAEDAWTPESDGVVVAWAEATNSLDGFAHSGFAEVALGRCASEACLTT